jgi:phage-related protein
MILDLVVRARNQASGPVDEVSAAVQRLKGEAQTAVRQGLTPFSNALSTMAANVATQALGRLAEAIRGAAMGAIQLGSDVEEMSSAFEVAFGEAATATRGELEGLADEMQRSRFEFMQYALGFQNIFVPLGYGRQEAAKMSTTLTTLVSDVASFHNALESDVQANFTSGLVGEHEALRKYGIVITETSLKEEIARMGKAELTGAALEQAKVMARMNIILASTTDAQGDAIRTAGSYANVMRGVQAAVMEVRAGIGEKLLPAVTAFMAEVGEFLREHGARFVEWFGEAMEAVTAWLATFQFGEALAAAGTAIGNFGTILGGLLAVVRAAAVDGFVMTETIRALPESLWAPARALGDFVVGVRTFALGVWGLLEPVRTWVRENVTLSDTLVALGGWLSWALRGPLLALIARFTGVGTAIAISILAVTGLRKAWETDFLGIRSAFAAVAEFLFVMWRVIVDAFETHGAGALREIVAFVRGGETNFYHLSQIFETFGYVVQRTFARLAQWIAPGLAAGWELVKGWTGDLVRWVQERLPEWGAAVGAWAAVAWGWLRDVVLPNTLTQLGAWWTALRDWLGRNLPQWGAALGQWAAAAWVWLRDVVVPNTLAQLGAWWTALRDWLGRNSPQWSAALGQMAAAGWGWLRDVVLPNTLTQLGTWWTALRDWFVRNGPEWGRRIGEWAAVAWVWLREVVIPNTLARLGEWWSALVGWFGKNGPEWVRRIADWAAVAWVWLRDTVLPNTVAKLGEWWATLSGWFGKNGGDWRSKLGEWAAAAWTWLRDVVVPNTLTKLGDWWNALRAWLEKNLPAWRERLAGWAAAAWEWIRDAAPMALNALGGWLRAVLGFLVDRVPDLVTLLLRWGALLVSWIGDAVPKVLFALADFVRSILSWERADGSPALGQMVVRWGRALWEWVRTEAAPKIGPALGDFSREMLLAMGRIAASVIIAAIEIGWALLEGVWRGLQNAQTWLWTKIGGFFGDLVRWVRSTLGIASPSTVFAEIGQYAVLGLVEGLDSETGRLMRAATRVGDVVTTGVVEGVSAANDELQALLAMMTRSVQSTMNAVSDRVSGTMATLVPSVQQQLNAASRIAPGATPASQAVVDALESGNLSFFAAPSGNGVSFSGGPDWTAGDGTYVIPNRGGAGGGGTLTIRGGEGERTPYGGFLANQSMSISGSIFEAARRFMAEWSQNVQRPGFMPTERENRLVVASENLLRLFEQRSWTQQGNSYTIVFPPGSAGTQDNIQLTSAVQMLQAVYG